MIIHRGLATAALRESKAMEILDYERPQHRRERVVSQSMVLVVLAWLFELSALAYIIFGYNSGEMDWLLFDGLIVLGFICSLASLIKLGRHCHQTRRLTPLICVIFALGFVAFACPVVYGAAILVSTIF